MSDTITLAHGNGGQLMQELIKSKIVPALGIDARLTDGAVLKVGDKELVFSTDSFTVKPLFFPGGDIGTLAVNGTVNDIAAMGARPLYLSCGAIIEEGFAMAEFERVLASLQKAAKEAGVRIVTGDTKVVEKSAADGIFINTAGIGVREHELSARFGTIKQGDVIVVNGPVGAHGCAIALARDDLGIRSEVESDCAPLYDMVKDVLQEKIEVVFMRDATRGGLATVLNELIDGEELGTQVHENQIPVAVGTRSICELLGYDPLYLANEGKMVFVVAKEDAAALVLVLQAHPLGQNASIIGEVTPEHEGKVVLRTCIGGSRVLDMLIYDQLPRIC